MLSISLKGVWAHKRRLAGTALAVFLGVAFLAGTLVLGDTVNANFDDLFTEATAGDVIVRNPTAIAGEGNDIEQSVMIDGALVDEIATIEGAETVEPFVEGYGAIIDRDGDQVGGNGPPRLAANWVDVDDLNPYRLVEGRAPEADDEVVINRGAADTADLSLGDTATVQVPAPVEAEVVGIATFGTEDGLGDTTFAAFTLEAAQRHLTGGEDLISSVLVKASSDVSPEDLVERIEPLLPEGAEAITGSELADEQVDEINEDFLGMLRMALVAFAGIALFVATFSIHNTFSIIVAQRTREMALLRAVGAARRQVLAAIGVEALVVGVVASLVGLVAGIGVAWLLKGLFDVVGSALPTGGLVLTALALALPLVVGIVATLVAAISPALRASRIAPLAALRDAAVDRTDTSRGRAVVGVGTFGAGVVALLTSTAVDGDGAVLSAALGAVLCLVGVVVLGPLVARPASAVIGFPLARLRGVGGALARGNAMRNPRRTSATASALLVGVSVVVVATVFAASVKTSLSDTIDRTFDADLIAASPIFGGAGIDPEMAPAVAGLPEVETAVGLGAGAATVDGEERGLAYADPVQIDQALALDVTSGSVADLADDEMAVARTTAEDQGWEMGSSVPVKFLDGEEEAFEVAALYEETDIAGGALVTRDAWAPHARQGLDSAVLVTLAGGVDLDTGKAAVTEVVDSYNGPDVEDREEYASSRTVGLDMLLSVVYALLALTIIIALLGIANTLSLSVYERRRELGILRAVGQTRRQLRAMVRDESVVISVFGTIGGLGLGLVLGWALVQAVSSSADIATFTAPVIQLAVVLVVGAIAGMLAAIRPARRAARLDILQAIHSD